MTEVVKRKKSQKRRRNHPLNGRADHKEFALAQQRAKAAGMSMGAFVRFSVCGSAGERFQTRLDPDREVLIRMLAELGRLNQGADRLARSLKDMGQPDSPALQQIAADFSVVRQAIVEALQNKRAPDLNT